MNEIGELGENIVRVCLTRETSHGFLFRLKHLREKWPRADFFVEIIDDANRPLFFIAQVKATTKGISNSKLQIYCNRNKLNELAKYPAPTYLIGVDVNTEIAYATFIKNGTRRHLSGLHTNFELNNLNLQLLYDEVKKFWAKNNIVGIKRSFNSITL